MKNIINDLTSFIATLDVVDIVFFTSILVLIILLVVLIHILRINDDVVEETVVPNTSDELDLLELTKEIDSAPKKDPITLTKYEEEQESKAIISYDELMNTNTNYSINYKDEEDLEGLSVKKIDVNNLINTMDPKPITHPATYTSETHKSNLISYKREEEFLETLKKLQDLLN